MKTRLLMVSVIFILASIVIITGCKYDVAEPLWDQPYNEPPSPTITSVDPDAEALPGVNMITIQGTNLSIGEDSTIVYFDKVKADIVSISSTSVTVLRPNIATDCTIKVVPKKAYTEAKYGPYKIDQVIEQYGSFLDNTLELSVLAVDKDENLFVVETSSKNVRKVSPNGDKVLIGKGSRATTDGTIGPDGNLYMTSNNRYIDRTDASGVVVWTQMPSGKVVKTGNFDAYGYFYTGGSRTDLCIVPPNPPEKLVASDIKLAGIYATDDILLIRVFGNNVYVASKPYNSSDSPKIWRHSIDGNGNIGTQELVLDLSKISLIASSTLIGFTLASDGSIFLLTDNAAPLISVNPVTLQATIFYKGIIPSYCDFFCWGNGNYIYTINGNTTAGADWTVYRVDMGMKSISSQ